MVLPRLLLGIKLEDHWKNHSLLKCCIAIMIPVLLFPSDTGSVAYSECNSSKTSSYAIFFFFNDHNFSMIFLMDFSCWQC